jgi:parallel beta-helix repeat protein
MKICLARFQRAVPGALLIAAMWCPWRGAAATNTVSNMSSGYVAGSLPIAVRDSASGDTIVFATNVTGTITLTNGGGFGGLLITNKALTILGPGADVLAISGNNAGPVFNIRLGATVNISGLSIINGNNSFGGAVFILNSSATLSNCIISGNANGGIRHSAAANTTSNKLSVVNCIITNNNSGAGGGIYLDGGEVALNNCTISGNRATNDGGGIYIFGASLAMTNCTITANTASRGAGLHLHDIFYSPNATIWGCTISGNGSAGVTTNGGGIYNQATVTLGNTILAGNTASTNPDYRGGVVSAGFNLIGDTSGSSGFGATGDQLNVNPMLGPLQNNNSGTTPTMTPLPGSVAIDQGKSFGLVSDQRGRPRPYDNPALANAIGGDGTDIGAVEVSPPMTLMVSNTSNSGTGSLRQAIADAVPGDSIAFASDVAGTIALTTGELSIGKSISILGPGANILAINGKASGRAFSVGSSAVVTISGLTITNSMTSGSGGGIVNNHSTLTVSNCYLVNNSAADFGGGIFNNGSATGGPATLAVVASTFSGNYSAGGGAIYNSGSGSGSATLSLTNCTLSTNSAGPGHGGGVYNDGGSGTATCALWACTLSGNTASDTGGGVFSSRTTGSAIVTFANTILQAGASGANFASDNSSVGSSGYNLSSDNPGGWFTMGTLGNQPNTDPKLGPLRDNGGPTPTHALLSNSPAIDKGKSFGFTTDQRGAPRPFDYSWSTNANGGDGSDIGAFELGSPTLNIQQIAANVVLSWQSYYGDFTLQSVTNVIDTNSWATVVGTPALIANQYVLTNGPISSSQFFRLKGN